MLVLSVMSVLLLAGIIGVGLFLGGLRISGQDVAAKRALFCAEAGLGAGRVFFANDYAQWNDFLKCNLDGGCPPNYPLHGFADTQGQLYPYDVRILDNVDEPVGDNPRQDNDLTVILESHCTDPNLPPQVLQQIISLKPATAGNDYKQAGGWNGTNNQQK